MITQGRSTDAPSAYLGLPPKGNRRREESKKK
jgi:hypothetical protein